MADFNIYNASKITTKEESFNTRATGEFKTFKIKIESINEENGTERIDQIIIFSSKPGAFDVLKGET